MPVKARGTGEHQRSFRVFGLPVQCVRLSDAQSLVELKAAADMGTEDSPFPRGFDIKHIDGQRVACYSGDSVRRSLVHYISENFAAGLDSLTDGLIDINETDNSCTADYDKYLQ